MKHLHLDFETFSDRSIKHGLETYFSSEVFEASMCAWALDSGPGFLTVFEEGEQVSPELDVALRDPEVLIYAFNAPFERYCLRKLGYDIPWNRFRCVMVAAYRHAFSGGLASVQEQIGLSADALKSKTGHKLMLMFSQPAKGNQNIYRYNRFTHPNEWRQFKEYCRQDVVAERSVLNWLEQYPQDPEIEQTYWDLDQRINERGLPIDMSLVESALRLDRRDKKALRDELKKVTGLSNANSNPQFLAWLQQHHDPAIENVQKATIAEILKGDPSNTVRRACELKAEIAKTSNAKYAAIKNAISPDGRLRNVFQHYGAQRTGRAAGRIVQPHNLPSSMTDDPERYAAMVESIYSEDPEFIRSVWNAAPSRILSQSIRGAVRAKPGNKLVVGDWGSIESRMLGWMAGCERINRLFVEGKDTYKDFATELFGVPYEDVTKKQRKFSKPPVLGCGYMLGWRGLVEYAQGYGVQMSESDARHAVDTYRSVYPEVPALWASYMAAIELALANPGQWYSAGKALIGKYRDMLLVQLPSGRYLHYYKPLWQQVPAPWDESRMIWTFTYMGAHKDTGQWVRINAHGGKVTENFDQAMSRDVLYEGLLKAEQQDINPVGHVHDEIIGEVPEEQAEEKRAALLRILQASPWWAPDLLLDGSTWIGDRYRKD